MLQLNLSHHLPDVGWTGRFIPGGREADRLEGAGVDRHPLRRGRRRTADARDEHGPALYGHPFDSEKLLRRQREFWQDDPVNTIDEWARAVQGARNALGDRDWGLTRWW